MRLVGGRRAAVVVIPSIVVWCAAAWALWHFALPALVIDTDRRSLGHAIGREVNSSLFGTLVNYVECAFARRGRWYCEAFDDSASGRAGYEVHMRSRLCWTGRRVVDLGAEGPMPRRLDGCVRLRDAYRLQSPIGRSRRP